MPIGEATKNVNSWFIYGITFPKKKMLDEYLALLEEAKNVTTVSWVKNLNCLPSQAVGTGIAFVVAPWNAITYALKTS